jgi:putative ABC transport system substrate-binding protein
MILLRRLALALLALIATATGAAAALGHKPVIYMILYRGETAVETGFRDYMKAHGIDPTYIVRDCNQNIGRIPEFVAEIRKLHPDLVYTWGTPVTLAVAGKRDAVDPAKNITNIPVVFTMVSSPYGSGLVDKDGLSHRSVTGTSHIVPIESQIRAIQAYRRFTRMAVMYNPAESNSVLNVAELRAQAAQQHFTLIEEPVPLDQNGRPEVDQVPVLLDKIAAREPQFLYLGPDTFIGANGVMITKDALDHRLPTFSATEAPLRNGEALFGLVSRYDAVGRLTAYKAAQILDGKPAGEIPAETLARFAYVISMPVAQKLDFYPPLSVLNFAEVMK